MQPFIGHTLERYATFHWPHLGKVCNLSLVTPWKGMQPFIGHTLERYATFHWSHLGKVCNLSLVTPWKGMQPFIGYTLERYATFHWLHLGKVCNLSFRKLVTPWEDMQICHLDDTLVRACKDKQSTIKDEISLKHINKLSGKSSS